jgi:manganese efflux pump family protein
LSSGDLISWWSLGALAVALGMDAFAVAVAAGMGPYPVTNRRVFRLSFHFGLFQALMPVIGWFAGTLLHSIISVWDHWIAFALLLFIGGRMIYEAARPSADRSKLHDPTKGWELVLLSIATSIDALAVGLTLAVLGATIVTPSIVIGIVAAVMTLIGMNLGGKIHFLTGPRIGIVGGLVLIGIGAKILVQHTVGG